MFFTRDYIKENIGAYIKLYTKESKKIGAYYSGIIKSFDDDLLLLDNNLCISYNDIVSMSIELIH